MFLVGDAVGDVICLFWFDCGPKWPTFLTPEKSFTLLLLLKEELRCDDDDDDDGGDDDDDDGEDDDDGDAAAAAAGGCFMAEKKITIYKSQR